MDGPYWSSDSLMMQCLEMPDDLNDDVSSLVVYRTNNGAYAKGKWIGITSTESINFTYNVGFSTTKSEETMTTS